MPLILRENLFWKNYRACNDISYILKRGDIVCLPNVTQDQVLEIIKRDGNYTRFGFLVKGLEGRAAAVGNREVDFIEDKDFIVLMLDGEPEGEFRDDFVRREDFISRYKNQYHSEPLPLP